MQTVKVNVLGYTVNLAQDLTDQILSLRASTKTNQHWKKGFCKWVCKGNLQRVPASVPTQIFPRDDGHDWTQLLSDTFCILLQPFIFTHTQENTRQHLRWCDSSVGFALEDKAGSLWGWRGHVLNIRCNPTSKFIIFYLDVFGKAQKQTHMLSNMVQLYILNVVKSTYQRYRDAVRSPIGRYVWILVSSICITCERIQLKFKVNTVC